MNARMISAILLAGIWINVSEFFRNEVLLKADWLNHYSMLGLQFPSSPLNGMVWVVWGFTLGAAIYSLTRRHTLLQSTVIAWVMAFVLMWLVNGNLGVLPVVILPYAVPLSLLEAWLAAYICLRLDPRGGAAKS